MTGKAYARKGWCPGVLRPMPAKDGLLVRLKISGGMISSSALREIAAAGRSFGNGLFDLTSRANLQIRGLGRDALPRLTEVIARLGMMDPSAAAESVRNVLVDPLAGLDGREDALAAAKDLEALLSGSGGLHALPAKFFFLIDSGNALSLARISADVRFDWDAESQSFAIGIGGCADDASFLGHCPPRQIPFVARRLAWAFLSLASQLKDQPGRMRSLVQRLGAGAVAARARLHLHKPRAAGLAKEPCPIGLFHVSGTPCFGAGAMFGRLDARMLEAAACAAGKFASGEIRLTPWRALLLPHVQESHAGSLEGELCAQGFLTDRSDSRVSLSACGGSGACESGTADTHADALALKPAVEQLWGIGIPLHVSGCEKSCGRKPDAPLTLVARAGLYDLAANPERLGQDIGNAAGLTLAAVREKLEEIARRAGRQGKPAQS
jgi:precorrin-3B synthase